MTPRPIMDAGPGLNFFASHSERLLFGTLGSLCVPETVAREMRQKATHPRFEAAGRVMSKLTPKYLEVLSDDETDQLVRAVTRISGTPFAQRIRRSRDLGETMVIAHAAVAAESGSDVLVLIDDRDGRERASRESDRLRRLRHSGQSVGSINLISTLTVLERAAGGQFLPDKRALRDLYAKLRPLDDGLPPLNSTRLLALPCWTKISGDE
ncbi:MULTISPECIES: hypothetical protein [Dietzia]|jgi:predicted nucleic acid-binding protein|uniref:PIN domain-containing protein n=2 Tax=Dietzia maris TaxID=37915 RepID=A0A365P918_9ACTN|nr:MULTISPECIES: hypothetical protein [Dietzia]MBB0990691.1 hypothetical protein [Dietzia sp. SLG510A3-30A2]MBC7171117.1 hypothetical protein [Polyangiaceae bacterium]ODQ97554.1 hypothetical protein BFG51_10975 [Dietzia alimentaria]MBB1017886.1 hypothetical protein [Dietzia sp. DQ11-71]MCY1657937.1 hypothetical protein [Dietzia sp. SL131]